MNSLKTVMSVGLFMSISFPVYSGEKIPYPDDYRKWNHVKSMVINAEHPLAKTDEGIHHIYANEPAIKGLMTGNYPDGATLVYDLLGSVEKNNTIQEGDRKLVGVMHKDSKYFSGTGGWGFEGFLGNSREKRLVNDGGKSCFSCHEPKKQRGYVFSELRK